MLKAYNPDILTETALRKMALRWKNKQWIGEEQYQQIVARYHRAFYTPNFFVRVGLFLFTAILLASATALGIVFLDTGAASNQNTVIGIFLLVCGGAAWMILEFFIRKKHHYRSGIDEALLYGVLLLYTVSLALFLPSNPDNETLTYGLLLFPLLTAAAIRYADRLITALAYICLLTVIFQLCIRSGAGREWFSFVGIGISALLYAWTYQQRKKLRQRSPEQKNEGYEGLYYWSGCLALLQLFTLLSLYISGNYYTVRETYATLNDTTNYITFTNPDIEKLENQRNAYYEQILRWQEQNEAYSKDSLHLGEHGPAIADNEERIQQNYSRMEELYVQIVEIRRAEKDRQAARQVPLSWFFIGYTILLPLLYLYWALRTKDRITLWAGLITLAMACATAKYYLSIAPPEITLTVAGIVLLIVGYGLMRFLKRPDIAARYGWVYDPEDSFQSEWDLTEAFSLAQTFHHPSSPVREPKTEFGGGSFGGGGAGNEY